MPENRPARLDLSKDPKVFLMVLTRAPAAAGWVQLFNGKDLAGWQPLWKEANSWSVQAAS